MSDTRTRLLRVAVALGIFVAGILWINHRSKIPQSTPEQRQKFYQREVEPLLAEYHRKNEEAVERCLARIHDNFTSYRQRVPEFVNYITRFRTRLYIARLMVGDWWSETSRLSTFITEAFCQRVFSGDRVNQDVAQALENLRVDLLANRQELLSQIKAAVSQSAFRDIELPEFQSFDQQIRAEMEKMLSESAKQSVQNGIIALVVSEVAATVATEAIAPWIAARVVTLLATIGGTSVGGATAAGAAGGAAGGAAVGPVGIAVGLGVGIVVGAMVDWWWTEKFKTELNDQLTDYISKLESAVIDGDQQKPNQQNTDQQNPGLRSILTSTINYLHGAASGVLRQSIVGAGA